MLVATPDGRTLCVHEAGDPDGFPVVAQHGTPSSALLYERHDALARAQGIRLLGYDRPGYGGSTRRAGRTVADCVKDVTALADALELERYATWGISGGGPHALACAALADDRLVSVASLAAPAPYEAPGLDWQAGMGEDNVLEIECAARGEPALREFVEGEVTGLREADAAGLAEAFATLLGAEDRAVLAGPVATHLLDSQRHGLEPGAEGWIDDDLALVRDWGFDVAAIDRPLLLLHGEDDRFVPVAHGRWLAEAAPGAEARIRSNDGHLTLYERRIEEVHEWLLSHR